MGDHAKLSPSSAHRWMNCPGSIAATEGMESPDSVYSREGTFAHDIAATALNTGLDAEAYIGKTDGTFTVDETMAGQIQTYLDVVRGILMIEGGELGVEQKVTLTEDVWGTGDAVIWCNRLNPGRITLHVGDLKFGAGITVSAEENEQLMIYALAAAATANVALRDISEVVLHIVQPRRPDQDGNAHRQWVTSGKELEAFLRKVMKAIIDVQMPDAPLVAGDWCQFCAAKASCPALRGQAMKAAAVVFATGDVMKPQRPLAVDEFTPAQLAKILPTLDVVEKWVGAVREHAFNLAAKGKKIPGFKIVERIGHRKWKNEAEAAGVLRKLGVDPLEHTMISPAEAERRKVMKKVVDGLTMKPVTGTVLVEDSDKRPPVNKASVFSNLLE